MKQYSVVICEAEFLCREGLKSIISNHPFYNISGEASTQIELQSLLENKPCDIITIDISAEGVFNLHTLKLIEKHAPSSRIIVISDSLESRHVYNVLGTGVNYYVSKSSNSDEIYKVLDATAKGEKYYSSGILDIIISQTFGEPVVEIIELTSREQEVVMLVGKGRSAKEIAQELSISIHTIYTHRKNIMKKLKLKSPVELITYAINKGLVEI